MISIEYDDVVGLTTPDIIILTLKLDEISLKFDTLTIVFAVLVDKNKTHFN